MRLTDELHKYHSHGWSSCLHGITYTTTTPCHLALQNLQLGAATTGSPITVATVESGASKQVLTT